MVQGTGVSNRSPSACLQGRTPSSLFLAPNDQPAMCFSLDDHPIRLNQEFFLDLAWGQEFFQSWKGCCFLQYPQWDPLPDFEVSSDASGVLGYGTVFQGHWFSGSQSIDYKEIFPIVLAAYLWGPLWASKRVNFLSDNHSVVEILRSAFQEPLPSCPWFAICPCWQLVTPSLSLCPQ